VDLSITATDLETFLSAISSIAVIAGAIFVVFQLRQNARQIKQQEKTLEVSSAANRSHDAFELIGKVIDPSFPGRRHRLHEVSRKYSGGDWSGFDESLDDFEVRNFANIYEQLGLLVQKGVIDLQDVMDALSAQIMADWFVFQPVRRHIMEEAAKSYPSLATGQPKIDAIFWPNFKWLAEENQKWVQEELSTGAAPSTQNRSISTK
jgi:hypothetical protein